MEMEAVKVQGELGSHSVFLMVPVHTHEKTFKPV